MASCYQYIPTHRPNAKSYHHYYPAYPASQSLGFATMWELGVSLKVLLMGPQGTYLLKFSLPLLRR